MSQTSRSVVVFRAFLAALCVLLLPAILAAGQWPTFRGDAQRSGLVEQPLTLPLRAAWTYRPNQGPRPAWPEPAETNYAVMHSPLRQTLTFDRAFHVVADAQSVYFGSSADDSIRCLDLASGRLRWQFITEGPIRLAPALHRGLVLAGSDDGFLYALDARTGKLAWKYRAAVSDKRLPGNGRMISMWPIRCGIAVDDGQVFFAAGLFPNQGVFLCCLDARTGKEVFKRPLDFAAQGTLLADNERLFVATGRTAFRSCSRQDGEPLLRHGSSDPWKKNLVGGSTAMVIDGHLATGPSEDGQIHWFKVASKSPLLRGAVECVVVSGKHICLLGGGKLWAVDRNAYLSDKKGAKPPAPLWSVPAGKARTMIQAGDQLIVAGPGEIAIHDAAAGKRLWRTAVYGTVEGLAVSEGRLLVSLADGRTLCYASGAGEERTIDEPRTDKPFAPDPLLERAAEHALAAAGVKAGYCLVLGANTGQLAWEIAKRSDFRVICREADAAQARAMRDVFMRTGLYGRRIEVHQGDSESLPYPRYFANLIVSQSALSATGKLPSAEAVLRALRPFGGVADIALAGGADRERRLSAWGAALLPEWKVSGGEVACGVARRGPLAGSGEWSHFYGDPGNTACSNDQMHAGPMELQWFGRPGPHDMVDRHKKGPAPLVVNGRLFVPGFNRLSVLDAYNGFVLWEKPIADSVRVAAFKDSSSVVATDREVLVAAGESCLILDAQTGACRWTIVAPGPAGEKAWGYLARVGGLVIGSVAKPGGSMRAMTKLEDTIIWRNRQPVVCSTSLFAVREDDGQCAWTYAAGGAIANPTLAVADGRVYFVESADPTTLGSSDGRITVPALFGMGARLTALDLKTGRVLWQTDADLSLLEHIIYLSCTRGTVVITGTRYAKVPPAETKGLKKPEQLTRVRYDLLAFDAADGSPRWTATGIPSYDEVLSGSHGEQVQHPAIVGEVVYGPGFAFNLLTGKKHDGWAWQKSHKCATISTSRYCAFSRFSKEKLPYIFDLQSGQGAPMTTVTRPGCWINTIPAGGLVVIPEASPAAPASTPSRRPWR